MPQREHARQGEFQAEGKQQEHHAQFGQVWQVGRMVDPVEGIRTDQQADTQITQHRRQAQAAKQGDNHQRGGEDNQ